MKLTASDCVEYREKANSLKTAGEYKELGRELRDKFGLTDKEAIDIMNNTNVIDIIAKYESED